MNNDRNGLDNTTELYADWIINLKHRIHQVQQQALLKVNQELVLLYWQIGHDILIRQNEYGWGAKIIDKLSLDLCAAFPDMKGFSVRNLKYMRAFAQAWHDPQIVQEVLAQLPWYHHITLLDKLNNTESRYWYAIKAIENNWSRNVMVMQIETNLIDRQGKAISNFKQNLPVPQSDLAMESLKDPYRFDFLTLTSKAQEKDVENALVKHVTEFLLELGEGFAFVGQQVNIEVGGDDFFIDLLFYHLKLRCYIVIELKTGDFKPEHLGQLGFYITAVDRQMKSEQDNSTIGLLLCKTKNKIIAEYALGNNNQPIGIAEYKLVESLPTDLQSQLPSIEDIEREFEVKDTPPSKNGGIKDRLYQSDFEGLIQDLENKEDDHE